LILDARNRSRANSNDYLFIIAQSSEIVILHGKETVTCPTAVVALKPAG
jgi:hypothetical protein